MKAGAWTSLREHLPLPLPLPPSSHSSNSFSGCLSLSYQSGLELIVQPRQTLNYLSSGSVRFVYMCAFVSGAVHMCAHACVG